MLNPRLPFQPRKLDKWWSSMRQLQATQLNRLKTLASTASELVILMLPACSPSSRHEGRRARTHLRATRADIAKRSKSFVFFSPHSPQEMKH